MKKTFLILFFLQSLLSFSQEPQAQPTSLQFSNIKPYSFQLSFSPSDAEKYLVVRSTAPLSFVPQDGVEYQKGQGVGNGKIFSTGTSSQFSISEVQAGITYYITIFAYNGVGVNCAYKVNNPLVGQVTSAGKLIGNYYSALDLNSPNFISDLSYRLRNNKIFQPYGDYGVFLVPAVMERDTVNGQKTVTCAYSNEIQVYSGPFSFTGIDYSREHCMPRSWMPNGGSTSSDPGADYHNLLLVKNTGVNSRRSNYAYGDVVNMTSGYLDCKLGHDSNGVLVFEPKQSIKGDAARAMFYQMVAYDGYLGASWALGDLAHTYSAQQDINTLLAWHIQDPVSPEEIARHEYIAYLQNNRNPFIDYPEWVDCIDFTTLTKKSGCTFSFDLDGTSQGRFKVYPNPTKDNLHIEWEEMQVAQLRLYSIDGKMLFEQKMQEATTHFTMPLNSFSKGVYILSLQGETKVLSKKIIIE